MISNHELAPCLKPLVLRNLPSTDCHSERPTGVEEPAVAFVFALASHFYCE